MCPSEIIAFSDAYKEFEALNTAVLAASVDSKFTHLAWLKTKRTEGGLGDIAFPIISDLEKKIADKYGVLITEGEDAGVALRGLFIIDPEGILRQITINDLPVGRSVHETLRVLKAFQFVHKAGDNTVCPANWQEGARTMKADPEDCKEYFRAVFGDTE